MTPDDIESPNHALLRSVTFSEVKRVITIARGGFSEQSTLKDVPTLNASFSNDFDLTSIPRIFYCLGSKSVVKYPKCSIRRQSTFADAEVYSDLSVDYLKMFLLNGPATVIPESYSFILTWFAAIPFILWLAQSITRAIVKDFLILKGYMFIWLECIGLPALCSFLLGFFSTILKDVVVGHEDISMVFALASTWAMFLAFGSLACVGPISYTVGMAYQNAFDSGVSLGSQIPGVGFLALLNNFIFLGLGVIIGYPIASASVKVLQGLWRSDLVALKGVCPNCGEEVFAFVRMDRNIESPHRANCHVCECVLEFRIEVAN
ncbi:uncharacterized protein LOC114165151 [Vigna unguiculata]|uniref:uncharacterized protein LOC114165151 n=1 Tax=Vigna unguiculata TaxID=3917 RepID=UPI001016AEA6|nr:uncharacterized protein LOC114165151 [Vigna unguiculata]